MIYVPWGFIALFIVFYFFYSVRRKNQLKTEERQHKLKEKQEELLNILRKRNQDSVNNP